VASRYSSSVSGRAATSTGGRISRSGSPLLIVPALAYSGASEDRKLRTSRRNWKRYLPALRSPASPGPSRRNHRLLPHLDHRAGAGSWGRAPRTAFFTSRSAAHPRSSTSPVAVVLFHHQRALHPLHDFLEPVRVPGLLPLEDRLLHSVRHRRPERRQRERLRRQDNLAQVGAEHLHGTQVVQPVPQGVDPRLVRRAARRGRLQHSGLFHHARERIRASGSSRASSGPASASSHAAYWSPR